MEKYIARINNKVLKKHDEAGQKRIKKIYLAVGGPILGVGLAGLLASFITFIVLFLDAQSEKSMVAWILALIFLVIFVVGCVLTRIGDKLLTEGYNENVEKKRKEKK